jgi:chromosome segregation ATPase
MNQKMSVCFSSGIVALMLTLGGCASSVERPDSDLQTAESSVQQAVASDAREFEPVLLNKAQNKVADAKNLMEQEKYAQAERLLEQAAVDAQLAGARSETTKAQKAVEEINRNIESLRKQVNQGKQQP